MTAAAVPNSTLSRDAAKRLVRAGLATGVVDFLWAVVLTACYGKSQLKLWQGVASVPFGKGMLDGGLPTAAIGVVVHFGVAFSWSALLLVLLMRSSWLRGVLASPGGLFKVAVVWGPLIWAVMSLVMIPLFTGNPTTVNARWFIQLVGHVFFVGLPMAWGLSERRRS
ncbi:MAG: hypothetical protein JWO05_1535 [Gemmatimonadetes bacterium]|nr:hypothetical protein [Gemmatimonadota bacterium]